jgi:two-component sensor histidine kinase
MLEGTLLALSVVLSAFFAFFTASEAPRIYWVFPFLIWAALRFGVYGSSAAVLATVIIAVWSATSGVGPFVPLLNVDLVTSLQGLILVVAISTFILAFSVEDFLRTSRKLQNEVEQRKAAQAEARETNRILEQINKSLDQIVLDRTKELRSSAEQNKVLLAELKHRIKNNLQIISSLTGFHTRSVHDEAAKQRLAILQTQITAMATTYDLLHQTDSTQTVDFCKIVPTLCKNISDAYGELVSLSTEIIGETRVRSETAVALSLVVNELITNSIKHASGEVTISVTCHPAEEQLLLRITDDGPGFPPGFDVGRATGFGLRMVHSLIVQVHGNWQLVPTPRGSTVEIRVPNTIRGLAST